VSRAWCLKCSHSCCDVNGRTEGPPPRSRCAGVICIPPQRHCGLGFAEGSPTPGSGGKNDRLTCGIEEWCADSVAALDMLAKTEDREREGHSPEAKGAGPARVVSACRPVRLKGG